MMLTIQSSTLPLRWSRRRLLGRRRTLDAAADEAWRRRPLRGGTGLGGASSWRKRERLKGGQKETKKVERSRHFFHFSIEKQEREGEEPVRSLSSQTPETWQSKSRVLRSDHVMLLITLSEREQQKQQHQQGRRRRDEKTAWGDRRQR